MATKNLHARTGNKITLEIDGKTVGVVQSVSCNDDYALEPLSGIGDPKAQEYVPGMARHTVRVQEATINSNSMRKAGVAPVNSAKALEGLVFDIAIKDTDGIVLKKYLNCSYGSGDVEVRKHTTVMTNATFMALDVSGEDTGL